MGDAAPNTLETARHLADAGRHSEAARLLRDLLDGNPPPGALRELAELAERVGAIVEASRAWRELRERTGEQEATARLAALSRATGDLEEALRLVRELRGGDPATPSWIRAEVELLLDLGREPEARQVVEDLRRASPAPCALCDELEDLLAAGARDADVIEEFEPEDHPDATVRRDEEPPPAAWTPPDGDVVRFLHLFGGREDVHARMWVNAEGRTGYQPVRHPLSAGDLRNHLLGNVTLGVYPVRLDGTVRFFAIDLDLRKETLESAAGDPERARELREAVRAAATHVRERLASLGLDALEESSGFKGRHFWVFLDPPRPAAEVHEAGERLLGYVDPGDPRIGLEFFPKQGARKGKLGNLIKLPLGIHLRTGRRSLLLDSRGRPLDDPWARLRQVKPLDDAGFRALVAALDVAGAAAITRQRVPSGNAAAGEEEVPQLPRPASPPPWTEADFELDPPTKKLLAGCVVLRRIVAEIVEHGRGSQEVVASLRATLGHLPRGPAAVNWLLDRIGGVRPELYLKRPLRGNPVSCQKLRSRFPAWGALDECSCAFEDTLGSYPTPLLHVEGMTAADAPGTGSGEESWDPEVEARRLGWLERRARELERERGDVRRALLEWMRASGTDEIRLPEGAWTRVVREGVESLEWSPAAGDAEPGADPPEEPR